MKTMTIFLIVISSAFILDTAFSKNLKNDKPRQLVLDNGRAPVSLNQVVRRSPTVTVVNTVAPTSSAAPSTISFGNSNSNNSGGSTYGRTATIVSKKNFLKINIIRSFHSFNWNQHHECYKRNSCPCRMEK
jgi:hypothetical protein